MPLDFQPLGESLWSKGLLCIFPSKKGFPQTPSPTFFLMSDVPTLERKIFLQLVQGRGQFYCSSIIERFVGIIFVQTCTFFLVGMHVGILSYSEVKKDKFCLPQGKRVYIFFHLFQKSWSGSFLHFGRVIPFFLGQSIQVRLFWWKQGQGTDPAPHF